MRIVWTSSRSVCSWGGGRAGVPPGAAVAEPGGAVPAGAPPRARQVPGSSYGQTVNQPARSRGQSATRISGIVEIPQPILAEVKAKLLEGLSLKLEALFRRRQYLGLLIPRPPPVLETSFGRKASQALRRPVPEPGGAVPAGAPPRTPRVPGRVSSPRTIQASRSRGQFATMISGPVEIPSH